MSYNVPCKPGHSLPAHLFEWPQNGQATCFRPWRENYLLKMALLSWFTCIPTESPVPRRHVQPEREPGITSYSLSHPVCQSYPSLTTCARHQAFLLLQPLQPFFKWDGINEPQRRLTCTVGWKKSIESCCQCCQLSMLVSQKISTKWQPRATPSHFCVLRKYSAYRQRARSK